MPDLPSGRLNEANGVRRFRPCPSCSTGDITPYALDGRRWSLLRESQLENWITEQGATAWPIAMHGWHFSTCVSLHSMQPCAPARSRFNEGIIMARWPKLPNVPHGVGILYADAGYAVLHSKTGACTFA